jgi:DNA-binding FadR family transcriptional regulator
MAESTKNPVLVSLVESLIKMCDAPPETSLRVPNPDKPKWSGIIAGHDRVLQAIREKNSEDAYFFMKLNLKDFHDNSLSEY